MRVGEELGRRFPGVDLGPALDLLATAASLVVAPPLAEPVSRDPADDKLLACARAAGASYLVSGDRDLLAVPAFGGVTILTPRAFVDRLAAGRTD